MLVESASTALGPSPGSPTALAALRKRVAVVTVVDGIVVASVVVVVPSIVEVASSSSVTSLTTLLDRVNERSKEFLLFLDLLEFFERVQRSCLSWFLSGVEADG